MSSSDHSPKKTAPEDTTSELLSLFQPPPPRVTQREGSETDALLATPTRGKNTKKRSPETGYGASEAFRAATTAEKAANESALPDLPSPDSGISDVLGDFDDLPEDEAYQILFDLEQSETNKEPGAFGNIRNSLAATARISNEQQDHNNNELSPSDFMQNTFDPDDSQSSFVMLDDTTPKTSTGFRKQSPAKEPHRPSVDLKVRLPSIRENPNTPSGTTTPQPFFKRPWIGFLKTTLTQPGTWIGAFMFALFHVVFSLTMGAAISHPHKGKSMLGLFSKMAALGIMVGAPRYWYALAHDIPALYPSVDLFTAPFLAALASEISKAMTPEDDDAVFLATFVVATATSLVISGSLLVLASVFKLANLGAFLPFPVLCGFFSAVGVMTWQLALKVDTPVDATALTIVWHHLPSVLSAVAMKYVGPKNPVYVVGILVVTVALFYLVMALSGLSRETMIKEGWFWSSSDLMYDSGENQMGFEQWKPPAPFGWINCLARGQVNWNAAFKAINTSVALGFLYLIRCSLHGTAMKKNVRNLQRVRKNEATTVIAASMRPKPFTGHRRRFSEALDIEHPSFMNTSTAPTVRPLETAKPSSIGLQDIFIEYGFSQFMSALFGGFAVTPCVAASPTMFQLRAEHVAPQLGSIIILSYFYLSDFQVVAFIPKPAFSSLLVLACIDMTWTWFIKSYFKTKQKMEWLVVPTIVVLAFAVGLLQAVFLGIAFSTFLFVAAFFRSGVVKYITNAIDVRSTIDRPLNDAKFLDDAGDRVQIIVLQNYLFFGNASSILDYIASMFEDPSEDLDPVFSPAIPSVVILDLTLVTGMDTSAVDAFSDILNLCSTQNCKLFLAGVSAELRIVMELGGVKPETKKVRSERKLRFFSSLDTAVGKAEDIIIDACDTCFESHFSDKSGFMRALRHIDEQHGTNAALDLASLEAHTRAFTLQPKDVLYETFKGERGIFFIEEGLVKIERSTDLTTNRRGKEMLMNVFSNDQGHASRTDSIGRATAAAMNLAGSDPSAHFRIARVGPGWVLGSIEAVSGLVNPASTIAVSTCKLHVLSFKAIAAIEEEDPRAVLKLYKLLSSFMAKRQENTIGQLGTLHSIMTAPAVKRPYSRHDSFGV